MHATIHASHAPRTARALQLRHCPLALALAACLSAGVPTTAVAQVSANQLPTGGSIAGGTGTINAANGASQVITQTSNRMALTWSTFDIGSAATVTFNQPSSSAVVLNQIQSGNPTQIFGNLNANGQVFLINSNAIIFGSTARINVGGLVASSLGMSASDFMSGNDILDAGANSVSLIQNEGIINASAGSVNLIGGKAVNTGTITATAGNINLVGADRVMLTFESGGFGVVVEKPLQLGLDVMAVQNTGSLVARGGTITLSANAAQGVFNQLINNTGSIVASGLSGGPDGSVSLVARGGGQNSVVGSGSIDVGAGTISIAADRGVEQSGVYTAGVLEGSINGNATFSAANRIASLGSLDVGGALSLTNAVGLSQAGALTVGSDSSFSVAGNTLALTDAANTFGGTVSVTGGNVAVNAAGALRIGSLSQSSNSALSLSAGGRLTLPTTAITTGSADLSLRSGDSLSTAAALSGNNVSLTGSNGIALAHAVTATGTLALTSSTAEIAQSAGALTVTGASTINAGAGAITLAGADNDFGQAVSLSGAGVRVVDRNTLQVAALTSAPNSSIDLQAGGSLILPAQAFNTGTADLRLVALGAAFSTNGNLGGRNITLSARDGLTLRDDITSTGTLQLSSSAGAITQTTGVLAVGGAATVDAGSNAITLDRTANDFRNGISLTGTGITVVDQTDLVVSALNSGSNGAVSLTAGGTLTLPTQALDTGTADLTLLANGGVLSSNGGLAGRNVTLTGRDGVSLGANLTSTGTLAITSSGGAITQSAGAIDATGAATLIADGAIALNAAGNDFRNAVSLSGTGISVVDQNDLTVGALTSGNNGALSLQAGGTLTLPIGAIDTGTGDLTLRSSNRLTTSAALSGNNISLTGSNGITLGADVAADSTLALTSNNASIVQSAGALVADGISTINAGTGAITLGNAGNDFGQALNLTGGTTQIVDSNALTLGTLATGALTVTSTDALTLGGGTVNGTLSASSNGGALTQTAALSVTGASTLNAGSGAIVLTQQNNDFQGAVSLSGSGINVVDQSDLVVSALTSGNNAPVSLTAGGALVLPAQAFNTGSADLTLIANGGGLSTAGNLGGANILLRARDGLVLGHDVTTTGALTLGTANAAILQSAGALTVGGIASVDAGSGAITLAGAGNDFGAAINLRGGTTQIRDRNALTLGTLATGALDAASTGALNLGSGSVTGALTGTSGNAAITQSGALSVSGVSSVNAGSGGIALTDANNDFGNTLSVTGSSVTIVDRTALTLGSVAVGTLTASSGGALNLGAGSIGSNLSATTNNGAITQSGALSVGGTAALNAGSGAISLDNAGNAFQGALSLSGGGTRIGSGAALTLGALSTGALIVSNNGALTLGSGRVASLDASSNGNAIGQNGALVVDGLTRLDAGSASIDLRDTGNDFGGSVTLTGGDTRLNDRNALTLGVLSTGNLTASSVGALNLGSGGVAGALRASSNNGAISQSGALNVTGASTLDAGTGSIALTDANNTLQGPVDLLGAATQLRSNTALTLGTIDTGALDVRSNGALNLGSGRAASLVATSNGNAITQSGALTIAGNSLLDAGATTITLTNAGNDFGGAVSLIGGATQLADATALRMGTLNTAALTLASGGALTLGAGTVDGALVANANGAIDQTGALSVTGTSAFDAGNNAIALTDAGNDFGGAVSLSGGATQIAARNALTLGTLRTGGLSATSSGGLNLGSGTIAGALTAQSNNGALTQAGALSVAGVTTLAAGSGSIALNDTANAFAGAVNLSGGDVQIAADALTLGALSTDALTATSVGALNLGSGNVRGALTGTSGNAAVTQTGALSVGGISSLNAGSGNIALTDTNNDFVGALALTGNAIAVQDRNDLSIAALQSGPNAAVSLVAGGGLNLPVSQIDTGNAALTLTANGGSLRTNGTLRGGDVRLTGANGIELTNALSATNTLTLNSTNAAITQRGGALQVAGNTLVDAGTGAITLDAAGNDFQGVLALSGGTSSVRDGNALTLGALNTGNLQVTSSGALNLGVGLVNGDLVAASNGGTVAQSGALTITGSTRIDSGGADIALTDVGNDFQAALSLAGGTSSVRDRNALALGNVDVGALDVASGAGLDLGQGRIGGALVARSGTAATLGGAGASTAQAPAVPQTTTADITQQGALTVVGSSVLDAGSGAIVLTDAGNDFQGSVQARGGSIAIADRNDLAVAAQATDALRLQAGGQLATSGTLSAANIALSGGTGVVLGHDVGGGNVSLSSGGAITQTAGSLSAARLSGNATGSATLTGSNNAIDALGDFSAQGLDLVSNRSLLVSGRVDGGASLRLRSGGELLLDGQLSGASSWLQAVAGIRQRAGSWIAADLLSGSAGGAVVLGDASSFIDNRIGRLGNFTASSGFSLTNGGDLLLVLANGSRYSVDAGNSALYLSVRGDLLQDGRAPLRNGTGTFAATGQIGTQQNPLYVIGTGTQTVAAVGAPPAYFNATTADGGLLDLGGGSGFNVPTSAFASRAQSSASRTVAFVDLSASGTPYRAFGLVRPGLRLPDDQQPACDAGDPDAGCSAE